MKQWWVWFNLREIFLLSSWFIHVTCQVDSKYKCRKFWYQFLSVIFFFSAVVALSGNTGFSSSIRSRLKASFPLLVSIRNRTRWAHTVYIECHRFLPMELEFIIPVCYLFRKGKKKSVHIKVWSFHEHYMHIHQCCLPQACFSRTCCNHSFVFYNIAICVVW